MKVGYLESHKSFKNLSLEIYYKKIFNPSLSYEELIFEIWIYKLLFMLNNGLNKNKTIIQGT